jgi:DNA polymerase III alpha subunit
MCAVLNNQGGFYSRAAYTEEARRMKIEMLPPDINYSLKNFTCENSAIRCGLSPVFELTERTIKTILSEREKREFSDLFDFIRRTRAGEKELEHLIKAGALGSIHPSAPQLLLLKNLYFKNKQKVEVTRFVAGNTYLEPFNTYQKILNQMEMLDFAVSDHPLFLFEEHIDWNTIVTSKQLEQHPNKRVRVCGWLVTSRRVGTSSRRYMKFLTLEDRFGLCEIVLFPEVYERYGHLVRTHGPYIITGKVQSRLPGEANIIAEKVELIEMPKDEIEQLLMQKKPLEWG